MGLPASDRKPILVVEDDPTTRLLLAAYLMDEGYAVIEARTGEDALLLAAEWQPAVVLLDLGLPTISGFDVLRSLKAAPRTRDIPIIVISAYADLMGAEDARQADRRLQKPFDPATLVDVIEAVSGARVPALF